MDELIEPVKKAFTQHFRSSPLLIKSPGRVNVIGEHIDYNGGHVLPAAINLGIVLAVAKNDFGLVRLHAMDLDETIELDRKEAHPLNNWSDYIIGVIKEIEKCGHTLTGVDIAFSGNLPIGSGLSSSAALECGTAIGLNELFNLDLSTSQIALLSQAAENNYAGVKCGLMDQYASVHGRSDELILLDCQSNTHRFLEIDLTDCAFVLCNSGVKHSLASSEYNTRRQECAEGLAMINKVHTYHFLCDVPLYILNELKEQIPEKPFHRCRFAIEENQRVLAAANAIEEQNLNRLGEFLYGSHEGLSKEYEVSCEELDYLVDATRSQPNVLGARMMGGGFGGCTINLVRKKGLDFFNDQLKEAYWNKYKIPLEYIPFTIEDGGHLVSPI